MGNDTISIQFSLKLLSSCSWCFSDPALIGGDRDMNLSLTLYSLSNMPLSEVQE